MRRQPSDPVVIIEHIADPQGPAKIARAYELIEREAARARPERGGRPAGHDVSDSDSSERGSQ